MDLSTLNSLTGGLMQLGDSIANANVEQAFGNFQASQYNNEAELDTLKGQNEQVKGVQEQTIQQEHTTQLSGEQQASEAAQGVDVNSGTARMTKSQTAQIGGLNYLTIGNTAALKSLGFDLSSVTNQASASMAKIGANFKASQSTYQGEIEMFDSTMKGVSHLQNSSSDLFPETSMFSNNTPTPSGGIPYTGDEATGGMPGLQ
jgi:hypothetical protein